MNNVTGVLRGGWHPKGKDGGRESWRGDFKGVNQVAGWVGKGKNPNIRTGSSGGSNHISRPLAALKDPAAFGAPPKNVNFHGGAALPNEIKPDRRGLGVPLPDTVVESAKKAVHDTEEAGVSEQSRPPGPPVPYRANRTGLRTDHFPPPPTDQTVDDDGNSAQETASVQGTPKPKPSLPPRLPPRSNSSNLASPVVSSPPPPTYDSIIDEPKPSANSYINQEAASRLGKAGISIPALGIGTSNKTPSTERTQSPTSSPNQLNEFQTRFSRLNKPSSSPSPSPSSPTQGTGTTLAQKQSALRTAQSLGKDPTSVSLSDAQSAATTANNFRDRHQDQISAGAQKANSWNKKYNFTGRMNSFLEQQASPAPQQQGQQSAVGAQNPSPDQGAVVQSPDLNNRKPPPPPPKKPSVMHGLAMGVGGGGQAPPPVPLGTKPSFA